MPTETLTWRDETHVTSLTDVEAAAACDRIPANHADRSYATSLTADLRRYGSLFPGKRYWLHVIASKQIDREQEAAQPASTTGGASGSLPQIAAFLTPVSKKIKSGARVTFTSGPLTVTIKRAGERSRWPGSFYVVGTGFGADGASEIYAGRIAPDGGWFPAPACEVAVYALLDEFEQNPAEYAAAYGRRTGRCFACDIRLDDPISMGFGYGRICAGHYGLPYGKRALAKAVAMRCERPAEIAG